MRPTAPLTGRASEARSLNQAIRGLRLSGHEFPRINIMEWRTISYARSWKASLSTAGSEVPRSYFDIHDGDRFTPDVTGLKLDDLEAAKGEAQKALPDVAKEKLS